MVVARADALADIRFREDPNLTPCHDKPFFATLDEQTTRAELTHEARHLEMGKPISDYVKLFSDLFEGSNGEV